MGRKEGKTSSFFLIFAPRVPLFQKWSMKEVAQEQGAIKRDKSLIRWRNFGALLLWIWQDAFLS
jgi:hypothetical protein